VEVSVMPIYEFKCTGCANVIERIMQYKDIDDDLPCPSCGEKLTRIHSVPALKFVGNDFYVTEERKRKAQTKIKSDVAECRKKMAEDDARAKAE
jgi:putative FmdB family regulatory protein